MINRDRTSNFWHFIGTWQFGSRYGVTRPEAEYNSQIRLTYVHILNLDSGLLEMRISMNEVASLV